MKKNNDPIQKQINKINYENHIHKQLFRLEKKVTQIIGNKIRTCDFGLVTLALLNKHDLKKSSNEKEVWLIENTKNMEDLYKKYRNKETLVEPLVYSKTLMNLINETL